MSVNVESVQEQVEAPEVEVAVEGAAPAVDEAAATLADPNASKAEKKAAASTIKEYNLKVYGQEKKVSFDPNNEEEVKKYLQKAMSFDSAASEKAYLEKGLTQIISLMKDPKGLKNLLAHSDVGVDWKTLAKTWAEDEAQENAKSPEQKEIERLRSLVEAREKKDEADKKAREAEEVKKLDDELEQKITNDVQTALASAKIPYSEKAVQYLAHYMKLALDEGYELTAVDVAPLVKNKLRKEFNDHIRAADDDSINDFFEKDVNEKLQKQRVSKLKKAPESVGSVKPTGNDVKKKDAAPAPKRKLSDFMKP